MAEMDPPIRNKDTEVVVLKSDDLETVVRMCELLRPYNEKDKTRIVQLVRQYWGIA